MQRFHPHPEPWGKFVDVKTNAVEVLQQQLRRAPPGDVFVSSACDGWQPIEKEYRLTRECCRLLAQHGFQVNVLTKSSLALQDFDIFEGGKVRIGITLTSLDERLSRMWEPGAANIEERLHLITEATRSGLKTSIMFGPLLPCLSDSQESIDSFFELAAHFEIDMLWVDALNPRPKVWSSVKTLLENEFPDLRDEYRRILFQPEARAAYLAQLRERVYRAARQFHLQDVLAGCP
jgi:DNA repair photolyase